VSAVVRCTSAAAAAAAATLIALGAAAADAPFYANDFQLQPTARVLSELGRLLFFDPSLSASGKLSCAGCHDPASHFGPPNGLSVQRGGAMREREGLRAVQSLMYTQTVPPFTEHYSEDEDDDSIDQGPAGGRTWDGRAQSAHEQALEPLLSPLEMANPDVHAVATRLRKAAAFEQFTAAFGPRGMDDDARLLRAALMALETFQQEPALFYPYTSKYDAWLRHRASLTPQELRGLAVFNDPTKGNCARCHSSGITESGLPQFTDYGYAAIGVPRNRELSVNRDPHYYDLGLCGPLRRDLADKKEYCGMFRTPSLRNVATRRVFFHNGVYHRLIDVLDFYAARDTDPGRFYPRGSDGKVQAFDDLPRAYWSNVDQLAPFGRRPGQAPALDASEVGDLLAFLETLTDGYPAAGDHAIARKPDSGRVGDRSNPLAIGHDDAAAPFDRDGKDQRYADR
jgi:cytochrome c peroxidase